MSKPIKTVLGNALSVSLLLSAFPNNVAALPKPPNTGTPTGNSTPGTTRPSAACPETPKPLTAIVANNGKDFTLSAHPTFWFYIPYGSEALSRMEFLLLNGNERETIYQTNIQLTDKPGIIKITLPNEPKYALIVNQDYRWRLNLDCRQDRSIEPDLAIDGWIRRVPMTAQLESQLKTSTAEQIYRENEIWYDAIDLLASSRFSGAPGARTNPIWHDLLQTLNLPWIEPEH
jgi:hypothetical protein